MCVVKPVQVDVVMKDYVRLVDGRVVRLGEMRGVKKGDYLDVYADIVIGKIDDSDVRIIQKAQRRMMS